MLCKEVQNYIASAKGLPFFYVVGDDSYNQVLNDLKSAGVSVVRTSDFCSNADRFPSIDELIDFFRTTDVDYKNNKHVVLGIGEYLALRGASEAKKELLRLKNTTLGNARVILLLRGVSTQVSELATEDARMIEQQRVFIEPDTKTGITIKKIPVSGVNACDGIKALLNALEDGANGNVMVRTELTFEESYFPVMTVTSSFSIVAHILGECHFEENNGSEPNWNRLLKELNSCENSLDTVFSKYGIDESVFDDIYESVAGYDFKNWLSFLFMLHNVDSIKNQYLKLVLRSVDSFESMKDTLTNLIISYKHDHPLFRRLYDERKKIIKCFPEEDIASFIKLNEVDEDESIYRLTDNTSLERKTIIKWIAAHGINDAIQYVYPDLSDYLHRYVFDKVAYSNELTEYFEKYKLQKVRNRIDASFLDKVDEYARSLIYTKLPTRNNAVKAIPNKNNAYLYWIDALGVEYLAYFVALAKRKGLSISIEVTRSDLPTITSINRQFYEQWPGKKYKEEHLDEIKHKEKGGYFFTDDEDPIHLVSELEVIEKAMRTAATELALHKCDAFVIASDHGASRLAVISKKEIQYDTDTKGEHSGRCCKYFENCEVNNKVVENGYIILSDYGRFKKSRAANVEVHGGASLEEIIVPVITLKLKKQMSGEIKVMNPDDIRVDRQKGVQILLYIPDTNTRDNICLVINDRKYIGNTKDGSHFLFELEDVKRATVKPYSADVFDGADLIGTISFKVKGKTATMNDDFDF